MSPLLHRRSLPLLTLLLPVVLMATAATTPRTTASAPRLYLPLVRQGLTYYRLAYHSYDINGVAHIYVMNADGTGRKSLTSTIKGNVPNLAWSPDGKKLSFVFSEFYNSDVYVMNADGSGLTNLTYTHDKEEYGPTWAPDSSKIAFSASGDIYVINADGTGKTNLTYTSQVEISPVWSPNGAKIAYGIEYDGGIGVMNADGTRNTILTSAFFPYGLVWSPDGQKLAFSTYNPGDVHVMNADGSGLTNLTNTPIDHLEQSPSWSPDGHTLAYFDCSPGYKGPDFCHSIYLMRIDRGDNTLLARFSYDGGRIAWAPDGQKLAFSVRRDIYVMNADGTGITNLTNTPDIDDYVPVWSPRLD